MYLESLYIRKVENCYLPYYNYFCVWLQNILSFHVIFKGKTTLEILFTV